VCRAEQQHADGNSMKRSVGRSTKYLNEEQWEQYAKKQLLRCRLCTDHGDEGDGDGYLGGHRSSDAAQGFRQLPNSQHDGPEAAGAQNAHERHASSNPRGIGLCAVVRAVATQKSARYGEQNKRTEDGDREITQ